MILYVNTTNTEGILKVWLYWQISININHKYEEPGIKKEMTSNQRLKGRSDSRW